MGSQALIAPLSNRMNLITILLIAALFGVLRLNGGGAEVRTRGHGSAAGQASEQGDLVDDTDENPADQLVPSKSGIKASNTRAEPNKNPAQAILKDLSGPEIVDDPGDEDSDEAPVKQKPTLNHNSTTSIRPRRSSSSGDLLDDIIDRDRAERARLAAEEEAKGKGGKLSDIQKILGMK